MNTVPAAAPLSFGSLAQLTFSLVLIVGLQVVQMLLDVPAEQHEAGGDSRRHRRCPWQSRTGKSHRFRSRHLPPFIQIRHIISRWPEGLNLLRIGGADHFVEFGALLPPAPHHRPECCVAPKLLKIAPCLARIDFGDEVPCRGE